MKKIAVVLLLFVSTQTVSALGLRLGVQGNVVQTDASLALGQLSDGAFSPTGYGVTAFGMADIIFLKITANIGYLNFGEQSYSFQPPPLTSDFIGDLSATAKVTAVPLLVGLRWEFGLPVGPKAHIGAQAGVHNFTFSYKGSAADIGLVEKTQTSSIFSFAPIVGMSWGPLDASLFYMMVQDFNYVGLRVGYIFGMGL